MLTRLAVCAAVGSARLAELAYSRRNIARHGGVEGARSRATYPLVVAVHTLTIAGVLFFGRNRISWKWLALLAAVQPLRIWILRMLGERWNARGVVAPGTVVETRGPYRYVRHPNYSVVVIELAALPLAFGLRRLALVAGLANAALLAVRIREEERALMALPGYRQHFAGKPRFIPFLF